MGTFNTKKLIYGNPALIPEIASRIETSFSAEGYSVQSQELLSGVSDISISKGGIFKSVLGMKTALKINLKSQSGAILFDASVGIFGKHVVPMVVMYFVGWPLLLTQIWGLVQQAKLDDKALAIAEDVVRNSSFASQQPQYSAPASRGMFCTGCGSEVPSGAAFCPHCGHKL